MKRPLLGQRVQRKSDGRIGKVQKIYKLNIKAFGGRWVAVMFNPPDSYGRTTDMRYGELRKAPL